MAETWDELRAVDVGGFSPTYPEYTANAWVHTTATPLTAAHAQGTSYAAWVATPEQRARYRRDALPRLPQRCQVGTTGICSCPREAVEVRAA